MARDSLFDGRYHYDHIYPRGRSGEVLRAYDTQQQDRMVVIKRPAPQDAPPIRAGQEVSIRTERRALQMLSGHPVLADLLGEGTFQVGGQRHLYIVIEYAGGAVLADEVLALAKDDARLPELEMLVIVDSLLDLLETAHQHDIVYNDVDTKHLFWDREAYQLKVIDWGNAVFLEGDTVTPQGVSRQSDVYQVGELLYFMLTGGQRLVVNGTTVDFGPAASRIATRMQHIVQRAVHPALDRRYLDIPALRQDLAEYRLPIERDRDKALERVEHRLQRQRNQRELAALRDDVLKIQQRDPGFPRARDVREQIETELHRLGILADLDAARIYLDGANWDRAAALLDDVADRARGKEQVRAYLLLAAAAMLREYQFAPPPPGVVTAIEAFYADQPGAAAEALIVTPDSRPAAMDMQWLLAERVQALSPGVVVLRPHVLRLQKDLASLPARQDVRGYQQTVEQVQVALEEAASGRLGEVAGCYQRAATAAQQLVEAMAEHQSDGHDQFVAPLESAARLAAAAEAVVEQLRTAGQRATGDPEQAHEALLLAAALDPVNPVFEFLRQTLDSVHRLLDDLNHFQPRPDGSDIEEWLDQAQRDLAPFAHEFPDPRIGMLLGSLQDSRQQWVAFQLAVVSGNREAAVDSLQKASDAIRRLNPGLANWLITAQGAVQKARYVQYHALNTRFGRAMADGWAAWDRGSGIEAERLGKMALEEVDSDEEVAAAERLIRLGKFLRNWMEGNGEGDPELTARIDSVALELLTESEDRYWSRFTEQMPSAAAYLNAMSAGLIEHFEQTSTAAQRVLFFHYVLRGVLEMYDEQVDDAEFWRAAAEQTLPSARRHVAYMALTNVIRDRQVLLSLVAQVDTLNTPEDVVGILRTLERSPLHLVLQPLIDALYQTKTAFTAWEQGDFRPAGEALESARKHVVDGERLAHIQLGQFRAWLDRLYTGAAELSVVRQRIQSIAADKQMLPDPRMVEWHQRLVDETELYLGARHTAVFEAWRVSYGVVLGIVSDEEKRRSRKLRDLDAHFNQTAGVEAHPAYDLYRFWRERIEAQPEFPAPPTDAPIPQYTEEAPQSPYRRLTSVLPGTSGVRRRLPRRRFLLIAPALILLLVGVFVVSAYLSSDGGAVDIPVTWETFTPTLNQQAIAAATIGAIQTATASVPTEAVQPTDTAVPTLTDTAIPSETPTPTASPTATIVPTLDPGEDFLPTAALFVPSNTPPGVDTPTPLLPSATPLPPTEIPSPTPPQDAAAHGPQNVLLVLEQAEGGYPWPRAWFQTGDLSGSWVFGIPGLDVGDNVLQVGLPADLLDRLFGEGAAVRLQRLEATLSLRDYEASLVADELVYFGLGLQGRDENRVAVQVQMVRPDAINVGARVGDEFRARTTLPVTDGRIQVVLERYTDGTVGLFVNGERLEQPRFLDAPDAPVTPFLFVQQGGVIVGVTDLIATFE